MVGDEMQCLGERGAGRRLTCGVTARTTELGSGREQGAANAFVNVAEQIRLSGGRHAPTMPVGPFAQLDKTDIRQRERAKCCLGEEPAKRRKSRMKCD